MFQGFTHFSDFFASFCFGKISHKQHKGQAYKLVNWKGYYVLADPTLKKHSQIVSEKMIYHKFSGILIPLGIWTNLQNNYWEI